VQAEEPERERDPQSNARATPHDSRVAKSSETPSGRLNRGPSELPYLSCITLRSCLTFKDWASTLGMIFGQLSANSEHYHCR
jgi:hypothetical protein